MTPRADRITKAILRSAKICAVPFSVMIIPRVKEHTLRNRLEQQWKIWSSEKPSSCWIAADPVNRHVALLISPELSEKIPESELHLWLRGVQDDLYATHFENALALGVLTLAMALAHQMPAETTIDGKRDAPV